MVLRGLYREGAKPQCASWETSTHSCAQVAQTMGMMMDQCTIGQFTGRQLSTIADNRMMVHLGLPSWMPSGSKIGVKEGDVEGVEYASLL